MSFTRTGNGRPRNGNLAGGSAPVVNRGTMPAFPASRRTQHGVVPFGHRRVIVMGNRNGMSGLGAVTCWDNGLCQNEDGSISYQPATASQMNNTSQLAAPNSGYVATAGANPATAALPTHDQCSGTPPLPLACFSPSGVAWTQAQTYARNAAQWNAGVDGTYTEAYNQWVNNGGKRWVNGQYVKTDEPPPPPPRQSSDPNVWYSILVQKEQSPYWNDPAYQGLDQQPYYMGGAISTTRGPNTATQDFTGSGQRTTVTTAPPTYYQQALDQQGGVTAAPAPQPIAAPAPQAITAPAPAAAPAPAPAPAASTAPAPAGTTNYTPAAPAVTVNLPPVTGPSSAGSSIITVPTPSGTQIVSGAHDISGALQQSTGATLPNAVSSVLPQWLSQLPIWQTGLGLAAVIYAWNVSQKSSRRR